MRCKNCGWMNPDTAERCEKCNRPLLRAPQQPACATTPSTQNVAANKATRMDIGMSETNYSANAVKGDAECKATRVYTAPQVEPQVPAVEVPGACPSCGYPLASGTKVCPMCKTPIGEQNVSSSASSFNMTLTCMDDEEHSVITLSAQKQLSIQREDVILLGGLRYKVN